jgi:glycosyltransferase involved in cell wall biosynthesis
VFPAAKVIVYAEYYYRAEGGDVGFDPEIGELSFEQRLRVRAKNGSLNLMTSEADLATTPTEFQKSCFPPSLLAHIVVAHDGIDTAAAAPRADASLAIPGTRLVFRPGDEVVTNLNRHLEPMRGIHRFLRALPAVLESRPKAHAVIVGSDQGSPYGGQPGGAFKTWKDKYLAEMAGRLDLSRVHFLGRVERHIYLDVLAVSACHVYLTFPFVLSWSLLESLAAGCLVVASDTAPVREAIRHGDNGMLVDFFDTAGLSAAIIRALADPAAFTAMRARARADAIARYDQETVCLPKMVDLIEGLGPAR